MSYLNHVSKFAKFFCAFFVIATLLSLSVAAYPSHTDYISDAAVILDENTENAIKAANTELIKSRNTKIAVCTVLNTEGKTTREYAAKLFEDWKVGHGVLILIATETNDFYAVQSNSIADILTNEKLSEIINSTLGPKFDEKQYSEGARSAANTLSVFLSNNLPEGFGAKKGGMPTFVKVILIIIVIVAVLAAAGYGALIYLEKKQARRRREEMIARRQRMANGYPAPRREPNRNRLPGETARNDPRRLPPPRTGDPRRNPNAPASGRPNPDRRNGDPRRTPAQRRTQSPHANQTQVINRVPRPGNGNVSSAATIQIDTAELRAAMESQKRK